MSLLTNAGLIDYSLTRSSRRRTMEISITDGLEVKVAVPRFVPQKEIQSFIKEKAEWIIRRLDEAYHVKKTIEQKQYSHGHEFLFLGKRYPLSVGPGDGRAAAIDFDGQCWNILLPVDLDPEDHGPAIKKALTGWYRAQAEEVMGGRIFHYARLMGLEPKKVAVRSQKRIWGSCHHSSGAINLNWQLIMTPLEVIDYVVVHELAHLEVPDHSRRFWKRVEKTLPDYKTRQKWLKERALDMVLP